METKFHSDRQDDPAFVQSFSEWLDSRKDSLPEPEDFPEWLKRNEDDIDQQSESTRTTG